jgi:hypothetical protein
MIQAMTSPVRFSFAFHQPMPLSTIPLSMWARTPHRAATDPAIPIDCDVSTMRLPLRV